MKIETPDDTQTSHILEVHTKAFGEKEGKEIAELVEKMLTDEAAAPLLSLVAREEKIITGHVLFSKITIEGPLDSVSARILAPVAVLPDRQNKGIGSFLINTGLAALKKAGVDLVFVLGHPEYYPRFGFTPAGDQGFEAPHPIPEQHAGAWMVLELNKGMMKKISGKIKCASILGQPQYWQE